MTGQLMPGLLGTKLHPPAVPARRVYRPHLVLRLNEGLEAGRHLTLVSAPAGFGKTTCVGDWVATLEGWSVAWLSLDAADDDPGRFFSYLVAALQTVDNRLGRDIEGVLRSGQLPPAEVVTAILVNDLEAWAGRCLLVVDDFHVIQDRAILEVLEKLVANLPAALHLVLLSREDPSLPLARLRANNQLTEIRAADLRFTTPDADRFLNEVMDLTLSPADVAMLADRTEGWIAGLQLAGLSVRDRADPSAFIATLSGSHRFILSYLTEEVLGRQPEDIQRFLLQTSILDKLSGEVCDAVTSQAGSRFLLERLYNANLFLIPLGTGRDDQPWYRYHHLFADLLRDLQRALYRDQTAELHRRASQWYAQSGLAGEAIQHALAATDFETAVRLIESHAVEMLVQGYSKTVEGWLRAIPAGLRLHSPRTNMAFVWMYLMRGSFAQAAPYLDHLQDILSASPPGPDDVSLQAEWLTLQSYLLTAQGRPAEALALAGQALDIVPDEDGHVRGLAHNGLASAYHEMGDYARSIDACQKAIQYGRATADFDAEMVGTTVLLQIALRLGRLHLAFQVAAEGVSRIESLGVLSPMTAFVYGVLGQVHYQWHHLEQAHRCLSRAVQLATLGSTSDVEIYHRVALSRLLHLQVSPGGLGAAGREIDKAVDLMRVEAPPWVREEVIAQQVRIELVGHRLAAAEAILKPHGFALQPQLSVPDLVPGRALTYSLGLLYNSALRILLARARSGPEPALLQQGIALATDVIAAALDGQFVPIALEALLLRAQMHAILGNASAGRADVVAALELAEPEGIVSAFVEEGPTIVEALAALTAAQLGAVRPGYVAGILAAFPGSPSPAAALGGQPLSPQPVPAGSAAEAGPPALIEPLSPRELEILRLIGEGCSNQEIAGRLILSLHTVKKHVSNILDKLGVDSRTRAVAQARHLKLLQE